ncbi:E3 ubiquitin-protein ligase TRIM21-like [Girardinichthys multiradiatus]|uniref:E3 ubiquitin-protein ligase TRIM21-like n=1 Tax=Girardinichthys multiradiatus TaxID=208333 RepID=UPI001FABF8B9|nr:E3 ubiquitin-protein ligase TRIM21-like [Girardinichthys multiradiatus]
MAYTLTQEQVLCIICMDSFTNPVSIPCGHNFCLECINGFWDTSHKSECPLCKENFQKRPALRVNVGLKDITEQFKRCLRSEQASNPEPPRRNCSRQSSKSDNITCDICGENKLTAVKSCLVCQASYCEMHLTPHLSDSMMTKHRLTDPATFRKSHLCRNHNKPLEMFCKKCQSPVCTSCTERDHKHHQVVPMEKESRRIKAKLKIVEAEIQQMIQTRLRKTEDIKNSMELSRIDKEKEIQTSVHVVTMVINAIERNQALLIEDIEEKHEAAKRRAEDLLEELDQEIGELQKRRSELQYLKDTKDPLHLLQSFPCLSSPLSSTNWSEVCVDSDIYIRSVRTAFSKLVDVCHELENKFCAEEVTKLAKYAVDVTLDPTTAASWLLLSPDGKKVSLSSQSRRQSLPDDPRRFDSCVAVLGKQSFTSGRRYWVVKIGDKTDWDLGVAKESINRKGSITVRPDNGYWAICRRKGESLRACAGPSVTLNLHEIPIKVGVFLDYEDGSVSFYNVDSKTHIYTYKGCSFTEPLYPYFNPCLHDNGRNTEPLIICPVETGLTIETAGQ